MPSGLDTTTVDMSQGAPAIPDDLLANADQSFDVANDLLALLFVVRDQRTQSFQFSCLAYAYVRLGVILERERGFWFIEAHCFSMLRAEGHKNRLEDRLSLRIRSHMPMHSCPDCHCMPLTRRLPSIFSENLLLLPTLSAAGRRLWFPAHSCRRVRIRWYVISIFSKTGSSTSVGFRLLALHGRAARLHGTVVRKSTLDEKMPFNEFLEVSCGSEHVRVGTSDSRSFHFTLPISLLVLREPRVASTSICC